jgi:hypothetical protein
MIRAPIEQREHRFGARVVLLLGAIFEGRLERSPARAHLLDARDGIAPRRMPDLALGHRLGDCRDPPLIELAAGLLLLERRAQRRQIAVLRRFDRHRRGAPETRECRQNGGDRDGRERCPCCRLRRVLHELPRISTLSPDCHLRETGAKRRPADPEHAPRGVKGP